MLDILGNLVNPLIMGIFLGGLYALNGLSLSLVFGVMRLINVAHGEFVILSSYFAFFMLTAYKLDPILSLIIGIPIFFLIGFAIQHYMLNRVFKISDEAPLLITFGLSIIIANIFRIIFSSLPRALVTPYSLATVNMGKISFPLVYLLSFIVSVFIMVFLREFLKRTYMGLSIRASSQNWRVAQYQGVNTDRVYSYTFGISMVIAAITGTLLGLTFPFTPVSGAEYLIIAFFVLVVGGLGNILGTFIIGILFGVLQTVGGHLFGVSYLQFFIYLFLFVVLAIWPQGFFGAKGAVRL